MIELVINSFHKRNIQYHMASLVNSAKFLQKTYHQVYKISSKKQKKTAHFTTHFMKAALPCYQIR